MALTKAEKTLLRKLFQDKYRIPKGILESYDAKTDDAIRAELAVYKAEKVVEHTAKRDNAITELTELQGG